MKRKDMAVFLLLGIFCVVGFVVGMFAVKKTEIDLSLIKSSIDGVKNTAPALKSVIVNGIITNAFLFVVLCVLPPSILGFCACVFLIFCGGFAAGFSCGYILTALGISGVFKVIFGVFLPSFLILAFMCRMCSLNMCAEKNRSMFKKVVAFGAFAAVFAVCASFQGLLQFAFFYKF